MSSSMGRIIPYIVENMFETTNQPYILEIIIIQEPGIPFLTNQD